MPSTGAPAIQGRDNEGFVELGQLRMQAQALSPEEFARRFAAPALVTLAVERDVAGVKHEMTPSSGIKLSSKNTMAAGDSTAPVSTSALAVLARYKTCVAFLAKRPGNPFAHMISIGRAMTSDVVYLLDTISKFHGYFTLADAGSWTFTDQKSMNGTFVNGKRLEKGETIPVKDGDRLRFGQNIEVGFLSPTSLHRFLKEQK